MNSSLNCLDECNILISCKSPEKEIREYTPPYTNRNYRWKPDFCSKYWILILFMCSNLDNCTGKSIAVWAWKYEKKQNIVVFVKFWISQYIHFDHKSEKSQSPKIIFSVFLFANVLLERLVSCLGYLTAIFLSPLLRKTLQIFLINWQSLLCILRPSN